MSRAESRLLLACCLAGYVLLTACSSSKSNPNPAAGLAGNWQISLQTATTTYSQSGFVLQDGKALNGQFVISGNCAGVGSAQGGTDGSKVSLTVNQPAQTIALTGTTTGDGSSMSGNYSTLSSGCGNSEVGTWSANRVKPLGGSFTGAFVSGVGGVLPFNYSGSLTEGPNLGATHATVGGSMTSSDALCFTDASISGVISGTAVVLNFTSSDGLALGQFTGTVTADATTATGTYDFFNANTPIPGCPNGDFGSATLTIQP